MVTLDTFKQIWSEEFEPTVSFTLGRDFDVDTKESPENVLRLLIRHYTMLTSLVVRIQKVRPDLVAGVLPSCVWMGDMLCEASLHFGLDIREVRDFLISQKEELNGVNS